MISPDSYEDKPKDSNSFELTNPKAGNEDSKCLILFSDVKFVFFLDDRKLSTYKQLMDGICPIFDHFTSEGRVAQTEIKRMKSGRSALPIQ